MNRPLERILSLGAIANLLLLVIALHGQYGQSFPALSAWISRYRARHPENPVLLVGVRRRSHQVLLNPRPAEFIALAAIR